MGRRAVHICSGDQLKALNANASSADKDKAVSNTTNPFGANRSGKLAGD